MKVSRKSITGDIVHTDACLIRMASAIGSLHEATTQRSRPGDQAGRPGVVGQQMIWHLLPPGNYR